MDKLGISIPKSFSSVHVSDVFGIIRRWCQGIIVKEVKIFRLQAGIGEQFHHLVLGVKDWNLDHFLGTWQPNNLLFWTFAYKIIACS